MKSMLSLIFLLLFSYSTVNSQNPSFDSSGDTPVISQITRSSMMIPHAIAFDEHPFNHNMHITSDGDYYYTINGGNAPSGQINKFDLNGNLIQTYPIPIDGRGLSFNQSDGYLYASLYMGDIVRITDLAAGTFVSVFTGIMQNQQASFAISPDGTKFYDFSLGTLNIRTLSGGTIINTISNLQFGAGNYGGEAAVAVDSSRIFTWNSFLKTVYIYDTTGNLLQTMVLDSGDNGHSLAIVNGYLFVSKDGNYGVGRWYGYNISGSTGLVQLQNPKDFQFYPNPATDIIKFTRPSEKFEIFDISGRLMISGKNILNSEMDVSTVPRGVYVAVFYQNGAAHYQKLVLQ